MTINLGPGTGGRKKKPCGEGICATNAAETTKKINEKRHSLMLKLSKETIKDTGLWAEAGIATLTYDYDQMAALTREKPTWIHFGAGNIFRGFIAMLQQKLLSTGKVNTGIIAVETYDYEIIEKIYTPYDNLGLLAIMNTDEQSGKRDRW